MPAQRLVMPVLGNLSKFICVSAVRVGAAGDVDGHTTQVSTAITLTCHHATIQSLATWDSNSLGRRSQGVTGQRYNGKTITCLAHLAMTHGTAS
jgi:hypothetical protein